MVTLVEEEKERLKIHIKDMKTVIELTDKENETTHTNMINTVQDCKECGYPCKTIGDLEVHVRNHQSKIRNTLAQQQCYLCNYQFTIADEFQKICQ